MRGGNGKGKGRNRKTKGTMERKKGEMCGKYDKIKPKRRAEGQITALHEGGGGMVFLKRKGRPLKYLHRAHHSNSVKRPSATSA
jgi:hypothetical protein